MLSALIQNFDTVEKVIETSANSAGSALEENERYLDSIQGKIDQFNNALQSMWSNTLDSDVVKWFINLGTELIKIVDTLGLIPSILLSIASFKILQSLFKGTDIIGFIKNIGALTMGTKVFEAETRRAAFALMGETINTKLAGSALVEYAVKMKLAEAADISKMTTTQLLGLSFKALGVAIWNATKAVLAFLFTNPVGWMILAIGAIAGGIAIFNHFHKTTEELTEELNELKSELQDVQSEIETVNSELETMEDRMTELLAKDSLTFTEEEELERLRKENDELQRKLDLLEKEEQLKQEETARKFNETMDSVRSDEYYSTGERKRWYNYLADYLGQAFRQSQGDYGNYSMPTYSLDKMLDSKIEAYEDYAVKLAEIETKMANTNNQDEYDKLSKEKKQIEDNMYDLQTFIQGKTAEFNSQAEGLDYFTGDNLEDWQIKSNAYLDFIKNLEDKWAIAQGDVDAKTNAINRIFNKDEYNEDSDTIDDLVKQLEEDPTNKTVLDKISEKCKLAEKDLLAVGLSVEETIGYFTKLVQEANFTTLEGKIAEVSNAATNFKSLLNGETFKVDGVDTGLADLFDKEGKIIQTKLSQVFQGTSDQTRAEITRLLEGSYDMIADGLDDAEINYLMNRMGLSFSRAILEIEKTSLATKNPELFPGLEDEISGIIDTFSELTSAVGSVVDAMDTLDKARAEEAYSGSMSLETLEALMQSTDNYADLIEVDETGAIKLATNAQEILVAQKLEAIKTNAELALKDAELAYEEALHTEQTYSQTGPAQEFMRGLWNEVGGAMAFVGSLWSDLTSGNWDGAWDRAKAAQEASVTEKETEYANKAAEASIAVAEAAKKVENAEKMNKIAQGLTPENVKARYSSEEASGGNKTEDEVKDDAFQREMDYWENRIGANQARYEQIQNEIDLLEAKGQRAGAKYYKEQIGLLQEFNSEGELVGGELYLLTQQLTEAETALAKVPEGSEEWWEIANTINDIHNEIDQTTASIQDLNDAMADTHWYMFDEAHDRVSTLTSDLENIRDILSNEELFDDEGNFTKEGLGTLASYVQELGIYEGALADARQERELFGDAYDPNKIYVDAYGNNLSIDSEQDWYDAVEKAEEKQDEWNQKVIETRYNIKDLYEQQIDAVEEYTSTLVENYQDYIDTTKEALDAERDLYEFKKSTEQKSKNIASIERRIASLSGSTNAADVAERRKLQAELTDAKSDMDDHYYSHAKDQQSQALDDEAVAYETAMNAFIESLYTKLEESTTGLYMSYEEMGTETKSFVDGVTESVVLNAGNVKETYLNTGETIDDCLMTPWTNAAAAIGTFASSEGALGLMNSWTESKAGAPFYDFQTKVSGYLSKPWSTIIADGGPVKTFKTSVNSIMSQIVSDVQSNVSGIGGVVSGLQTEIDKIKDTTIRITTVYETQGDSSGGGSGGGGSGSGGGGSVSKTPEVKLRGLMKTSREMILGPKSFVDANTETINGVKYYRDSKTGYYYKISDLNSKRKYDGGRTTGWAIPKGTWFYTKNAKGTLGTTYDQWALTDESWIGEEITLAAGKNGQLQYLKKGSAIMPADISANLVEWGKINPSMLNVDGTPNINMISNAVNKPEFNFTFDALVKAENITEETIPAVKKLVTQELNRFTKELNYALKGKGAR